MNDLHHKTVLGVILARGGSKGIPKKNIYPLCGHPLIAYSITAALNSGHIDELVVSTDSEEIARVARRYGSKVPFIRPTDLAGDKVPSVDALRHAALEAEEFFGHQFDYIVELPCVAPLRDYTHINAALQKLHSTGCDSVISVVDTGEKHPIRLKKIIDDQIFDFCDEYPEPAVGSRRQDLKPESYVRNGAIYSMTRKTLVDNHSRHGLDSRPYIMSSEKSINIDEPLDMKLAEFFIENGYCDNIPVRHNEILVTTPLHFIGGAKKEIEALDATIRFLDKASKQDVIDCISTATGWICQPCPEYKIDEDILKHAKDLEFIASTSTGTSHIDKEYCEKHNIEVLCLRDSDKVSGITASSEFTFNLVLSTVRKTPYAFDSVKAGKWREVEDSLRGRELNGLTMGIIGYGRIGSNNARYANAFGMRVIAYDPYIRLFEPYVEQAFSHQDVLTQADVIMICVHLSDDTYHMVDKSWFDLMKDGVYFINTSRGEIIDEDALLDALKTGKVAAAGVDVISNEQKVDKSNHPLIKYAKENSNLIVTPHIAGLTYDSEGKAAKYIAELVKERL